MPRLYMCVDDITCCISQCRPTNWWLTSLYLLYNHRLVLMDTTSITVASVVNTTPAMSCPSPSNTTTLGEVNSLAPATNNNGPSKSPHPVRKYIERVASKDLEEYPEWDLSVSITFKFIVSYNNKVMYTDRSYFHVYR